MVSVMIFVIVIIIYFQYINNLETQEQHTLNELTIDSNYIANSLVSEGYPKDWNTTSVERIGLTDNNHRINSTKLESFITMDYNTTRRMFGTNHHYYMYFEDTNNTVIPVNGTSVIGYYSNDSSYLIKRTRLVILDSEIVRMEVNAWH